MILKNGTEFTPNRGASGRNRYVLTENGNEISLTGVTTILNEQAKPFLINWAAAEAYKDSLTKSKDQIEEIIKLKKYAHAQKSQEARDTGTLAHSIAEQFIQAEIKRRIEKNMYKKYSELNKEELEKYGYPDLSKVTDKESLVSVKRFIDWAEAEAVEFTQSEISVFHGVYNYAGSFDFICKIKGDYYLGDYKTSKQIDNTYYAQASAYIKAVNYMQEIQGEEKIKFKGAVIVKSTKVADDVEFFEKAGSGFKKVTIPAFEVAFSQEIEKHFTYFLGLLCAYRYNKGQEVEFFKKYADDKLLTEEELLEINE